MQKGPQMSTRFTKYAYKFPICRRMGTICSFTRAALSGDKPFVQRLDRLLFLFLTGYVVRLAGGRLRL